MTIDKQIYEQILSGAEQYSKSGRPVTCLGQTFPNEDVRREYFIEELRKKLRDREFRKIEGFPKGTDEQILALSDPPYYTACPNPWVNSVVHVWQTEKNLASPHTQYHREPFAADVSEGKNDPIYNAHSYHTKVPHKAVMRYILHYTDPGDIVFDAFCGTGMTGVAAQLCGDPDVVSDLGYRVETDGTILESQVDGNGVSVWVPFSKIGSRKVVLNDLAPAATFIAYNYNTYVDREIWENSANKILKEIEKDLGWMYETKHSDGRIGKINYCIWSDVFICIECLKEVVFWDVAIDKENGKVFDEFKCPHCNALLTKRRMDRAFVASYDNSLKSQVKQAKQIPVRITYTIGKDRFDKIPDQFDMDILNKINSCQINSWFPTDRMMPGQETRRNDSIGITHIHHFYTKRNLAIFSLFFSRAPHWLKWAVTGSLQRGSKQHQIAITRIGGEKAKDGGATAGHRRGTLYIPSNQVEMNAITLIRDRVDSIRKAVTKKDKGNYILSTSSATLNSTGMKECFDYLFFDPPFGANIAYSELNSIFEAWLGVTTNQDEEAIEDKAQNKNLIDYLHLMTKCFRVAYEMLKPGRWMTVEFSNTSAAVWNAIQTSLQEAGFIVANVSALDKKRGGLNAIIGTTAVKQDLAISAYKPNGGFEERFKIEASSESGVWDFIRTHLKYLPVVKLQGSVLQYIPERDSRILFDQMISYYVRMGFQVPMDSRDFQSGLSLNFIERDGMFFLPEQAHIFDRQKVLSERIMPNALFVSDESSAIQWIRQILKEKPQTFQDLNPVFMQQLGGWNKNEQQLDLRELLGQNFLIYEGGAPVPEQIHSYLSSNWKELRSLPKDNALLIEKAYSRWYVPDLNKASDLEKIRDKALLREFSVYLEGKKKLKIFRIEAIRVGFKKAWQERDYGTIISVAVRIPDSVLQEDPKLLMWYDQAITRVGQG